MVKIFMILTENLKRNNIIIKSKSKNRWDLIREMVDITVKNKELTHSDQDLIINSLLEREKSMSTGIGNGVAIPHCTTDKINDIIIIFALHQKGIDFDSIDNQPVKDCNLTACSKK